MPRAIPRKAKNIHVLKERKKGKRCRAAALKDKSKWKKINDSVSAHSLAPTPLAAWEKKKKKLRTYIYMYMYIEEMTILGLET